MCVFGFGRSTDAALPAGGEVGGVTGYFGEKGDGSIARRDDLKGAGLMVRLRGMANVATSMRPMCMFLW